MGGEAAWWIDLGLLGPGACVLSGGAGKDISFELALAALGCRVAVFDPSPTGLQTFARSTKPSHVQFHSYGLNGRGEDALFSPPADSSEGSFTAAMEGMTSVRFNCVTPLQAMTLADIHKIDLLKIDIEGFEYEFLDAMVASQIFPTQIAVEFHHFMPTISVFRTIRSIRMLLKNGYQLTHKAQCDYLFIRRGFKTGA